MKLRNLLLRAAIAATLVLTLAHDAISYSRFGFGTTTITSGCWTSRPAERAFASLTNSARRRSGRRALTFDRQLSAVARKHTSAMAWRRRLYHTPNFRLVHRVTNWNTLGENVGVGGRVTSLQSAFMHSPAHRANILYGPFRYVGVGTVTKHGRLWVTVEFESARNPGTRLRRRFC